ncbi:MAG: RNase P subunit [Thaumarchaeota archaeon]|nr:RNase P subunit [Nitrososphaerota archaeon]
MFNQVFIANPISKEKLRYRRSRQKVVASQEVNSILEQAVETAKTDIELAKKQAAIARRICLKFNIRLLYEKRQLLCRGCKQFIVPGINARVRISSKPRMLILTCLDCKHTYRRPLKA